MKQLHYILIFILPLTAFSQCLSGDCYNGFGIVQYESGNRFEGIFKDGLIGEHGKFIFTNGDYFEGKFVNELNTEGKFYYAAENVTFNGTFYPDGAQKTGSNYFHVNGTTVYLADGNVTTVDNPEIKRLAALEAERQKGRPCDKCAGKGKFEGGSYTQTTENYYSINYVNSSGNTVGTSSGNVGKSTTTSSSGPSICSKCKGTGKIYDVDGVIINSGKY